jgi:cell division protease FtsH
LWRAGPLLPGVSEASQRSLVLVDDEVRRIVEESHTDVLALLRENRWRLDALASTLLKYETLGESMAYEAAGLPEPGAAPGSFAAAAFGTTPPAA